MHSTMVGLLVDNRLLADQTEENFDNVFAVNVKALFLLLKDELKQMLAQGQGRLDRQCCFSQWTACDPYRWSLRSQ
jgi:hypothetical protein